MKNSVGYPGEMDISKLVKDNPLMTEKKKEEDEHAKYMMFEPIHQLIYAACDMYKEGDCTWDDCIKNLVDAIGQLKGKEKKLKEMV